MAKNEERCLGERSLFLRNNPCIISISLGCMLTYLWKKLRNYIKQRENERKRKKKCSKFYPSFQGMKWYSFSNSPLLLGNCDNLYFQMSPWHHKMVDEAEFWISCQRLGLISSFSLTIDSKFSAIYHDVAQMWHLNCKMMRSQMLH